MSYESYWDCLPNDVIKIIKEYSVHPIINVINECIQWIEKVLVEDNRLLQNALPENGYIRSFIYYLDDDDDIATDEYFCAINTDTSWNIRVNVSPIANNNKMNELNELYKFREKKYTKFKLRRLLYRSFTNIENLISKKELASKIARNNRRKRNREPDDYYAYYKDNRVLNFVRQEQELNYLINHYWSTQK